MKWNQNWNQEGNNSDFKDFLNSLVLDDLGDFLLFTIYELIEALKEKAVVMKYPDAFLAMVDVIRELKYLQYKQATDKNMFASFGVMVWNDVKQLVAKRFGLQRDFNLKLENIIATRKDD